MAQLHFHPLPTAAIELLRAGGRDAYGLLPERVCARGESNPCRHCLDFIPDGADMLILAYRPFTHLQPYAETGPIFLCADACAPWSAKGVPPILTRSPAYLVKGYSESERIVYGTGKVVPAEDLEPYAEALLDRADVHFVDVRSARNNCFQVRITRHDHQPE